MAGFKLFFLLLQFLIAANGIALDRKRSKAEQWPALIEKDGHADIPAQKSPYYGERTVRVYVYYPAKTIKSVKRSTSPDKSR